MRTALQLLDELQTRCLDDVEDRRVVAAVVQLWHDEEIEARILRDRGEIARWAARIKELERRLDRVVSIAQGRGPG